MNPGSRLPRARGRRSGVALALLSLLLAGSGATVALGNVADLGNDAIVGTWVGQANQPDQDPFDVRLTFVSPNGGVSRYPNDPVCGGILAGDSKGDHYEYVETITYGGSDEIENGCLGGTMKLTVDGDTMKFDWSNSDNGQELTYSGELHREGAGKR